VSAAARSRKCRARRANGLIVLRIEANEVGLIELLTEAGLLPPAMDHDRNTIAAATERLLATLIEEHATRCGAPSEDGA
jgi:hypothetical protein